MSGTKSSLRDWLMLVPGVGYIFFFITSSILVTILQSFGLFSITGVSRFTFSHWRILATRGVLDSLLFSLKMGIGSSLGTLLLAFPLALFFRKSTPGKTTLGSMVKIPMFVPALVAAFLIANLISYNGFANDALVFLRIVRKPVAMLNDPYGIGVIVIQVWKNLPYVLLIISASVAGIRADIIDAARGLGAGPLGLLRHVFIPLAMPGILVSMILMFIMAFGDYPITRIEGPVYPPSLAVRMYTTASLYQEWNQAAVLGVIIVVTALFVVAGYSKLAGIVTRD